MNKAVTYYISGPMTGKPGHNYDLFNEVEADLREAVLPGDMVINPARNFGGDRTRKRSEYMQLDIEHVLKSDVVVLLPGWEGSEGAKLEVAVARQTGKEFRVAEKTDGLWRYFDIAAPAEPAGSPRASALNEAKALITGDRNNSYGPPTQDFARTASMASSFGFRVVPHEGAEPVELSPHHVAIFLILLKMSRLAWTPGKRDSWVDTAGYAGCGYECAVEAS